MAATKSAVLAIRIISDSKQAERGLDRTGAAAGRLDGKLRGIRPAVGVAVAALGYLAQQAGAAAAEAEQAAGAVESVYGEHAAGINRAAEAAADALGLSERSYQQLATVIGSQLKNMGMPMDQVSAQSQELIGLGADLAATYGGTTADAVAALSSLLRGERDPIERYGVSIKAATVEARLAEQGLSDLTGEAKTQAEAAATLALLTEQTAAAHGQFAEEADTAAGAQERANAKWQDASAQLGEVLLPFMVQLATVASDVATWLSENEGIAQLLIVALAALAIGVGVLTAAQWAFNIAAAANPVGLVVLAIVAAIAALTVVVLLVIKYWDDIERAAADAWGGIVGWIESAVNWLLQLYNMGAPQWLKDLLGFQGGQIDLGGSQSLTAAYDPPADLMLYAVAPENLQLQAAASPLQLRDGALQLRSGQQAAGNVYQITIHGVTDKEGAAREIRRVLNGSARSAGYVDAGAGRSVR